MSDAALAEPVAPTRRSRLKLGSDAHKALFCSTLLETHNPYKPAVIAWPRLDPETQAKITGLPIWDIAVQTEGKAGLRVRTYGERCVTDPLLKRAVEMNAFEESRHKLVLSNMVEAYGIKLGPEPEYKAPRDAEWAFMVTGFSECIDSFFAFGLFKLARDSGFFPADLVDTFEPVMQEEGRHILFFVNWMAWHRRTMPLWKRPWFEARVMGVWAFLVWERIGIARGMEESPQAQDNNFTLNGSKELGVEVTPAQLMSICLAENDRRLAGYDARLIRPNFVPMMVRLARRFLGGGKRRAPRFEARSAA